MAQIKQARVWGMRWAPLFSNTVTGPLSTTSRTFQRMAAHAECNGSGAKSVVWILEAADLQTALILSKELDVAILLH